MRYGVLLGLLLCCGAASAQVYKWKDANGVTHYGSQPPANVKNSEVKLKDPNSSSGGNSTPAQNASLKQKELEFRQRQAQREQEETRVAQEKAKRDEDCRSAKLQLADMRLSGRIYELNDRGERVFMSDAQRDAELARREAEYNRRCS
jgi:hypothetical protein